VASLDETEMSKERGIVRKAVGYLGAEYPLTFLRALRVVDITTDQSQVKDVLAILAKYFTGAPPWAGVTDVSWWKLQDYLDLASPPDREPDPHLVGDLAAFISASGGTLSAVTLAGIDEYREPWELEVPPETAA
jgi:hypothetical protein